MSGLTEAQTDELLAAYALDALPQAEARRVEEHLRTCAEHRAAVAEMRQTSSLLSLTPDELEPSPELRRRIVEAVKANPARPLAVENQASSPVPLIARPQVRRLPSWLAKPSRLALAATVAIALGISALIGYQVGQIGARPVAYTFQGDASAAPGAEARLVYFKDRKESVLAVNGLPKLGSGQVYEMWFIKNGVPVDKGISSSTTGDLGAQLTGDITQFQQFAITIEPGEQQLPTTKPILIGNLQSRSS
jgi:anti-sigma-K factor RskA